MLITDPRKYIVTISAATLLAGFSLASLVVYTDPSVAGWSIFIFFYLSLFLLATGVLTLSGLVLRRLFGRGLFAANFSDSFRQSLFLSIFLVGCVILSSHNLLFWWVALALFLPLAAVEAFLNLKI